MSICFVGFVTVCVSCLWVVWPGVPSLGQQPLSWRQTLCAFPLLCIHPLILPLTHRRAPDKSVPLSVPVFSPKIRAQDKMIKVNNDSFESLELPWCSVFLALKHLPSLLGSWARAQISWAQSPWKPPARLVLDKSLEGNPCHLWPSLQLSVDESLVDKGSLRLKPSNRESTCVYVVDHTWSSSDHPWKRFLDDKPSIRRLIMAKVFALKQIWTVALWLVPVP